MLYTKHLTITDTDLHEIFAVPEGYVCNISYVFVANHDNSTNAVDLYWDNIKDSESSVPSPGTTTLNYTFDSPAASTYLEVRKNTTVLTEGVSNDYTVDLVTKTVTLTTAVVSGEEYTISHLEPQVYIFDDTNIAGNDREVLGGQSSVGIFALHEGETVKAQTTAIGNVEVVVTFDLVEKPSVFVNFNGS